MDVYYFFIYVEECSRLLKAIWRNHRDATRDRIDSSNDWLRQRLSSTNYKRRVMNDNETKKKTNTIGGFFWTCMWLYHWSKRAQSAANRRCATRNWDSWRARGRPCRSYNQTHFEINRFFFNIVRCFINISLRSQTQWCSNDVDHRQCQQRNVETTQLCCAGSGVHKALCIRFQREPTKKHEHKFWVSFFYNILRNKTQKKREDDYAKKKKTKNINPWCHWLPWTIYTSNTMPRRRSRRLQSLRRTTLAAALSHNSDQNILKRAIVIKNICFYIYETFFFTGKHWNN